MISIYIKDIFIDLMDFFIETDEDELIALDNEEYATLRQLLEVIEGLEIKEDEKRYAIKSLTEYFKVPE